MKESYENLLGHIEHHDIRGWLLYGTNGGAKGEDANTIMNAIKKMSKGQLQRGFARMLAKHVNDNE